MNVSFGLAFLGGLVSFFSPCVLPVVPAYFSFLLGSSLTTKPSRKVLLIRSLLFVLGFSAIFILLGASASALGQLVNAYRSVLMRIGGVIVIVFGLQMMGVLNFPWLLMEKRLHLEQKARGGGGRALLLGLAFAAGWTPCIGPVLSGILMLAGSSGSMGMGSALLGTYSLGLAIPFLLFAFLADQATNWIRRSGSLMRAVSVLGGAVLVLLGVLLFFDLLSRASALLPVIPLPF